MVELSARELIASLLERRAAAKKLREFATADALRDALTDAGVVVTDTPEGTTWELSTKFDPTKLDALR